MVHPYDEEESPVTDEDDDDERTAPILQVVDFNALHEALGDTPPSPIPPAPSPSQGGVGESQGRTNATYASRPRPVPATRAPAIDPNTPAVIISTEDTIPTGPPVQMTVPMMPAPRAAVARSAPPPAINGPAKERDRTGRISRHPRPRVPTLIVRPRGPTALQKAFVFVALLVIFVAGGIAYLLYSGFDANGDRALPPAIRHLLSTVTKTTHTDAPAAPRPAITAPK
jgi:hypothetical protein